jgi:hypothetical protein
MLVSKKNLYMFKHFSCIEKWKLFYFWGGGIQTENENFHIYEYYIIIFHKRFMCTFQQASNENNSSSSSSSSSSSEGKIIQKLNLGYATALGWVQQH